MDHKEILKEMLDKLSDVNYLKEGVDIKELEYKKNIVAPFWAKERMSFQEDIYQDKLDALKEELNIRVSQDELKEDEAVEIFMKEAMKFQEAQLI